MESRIVDDDFSINSEGDLWRRIPPYHYVYDGNLGCYRASSAAFENDEDGQPMSAVSSQLANELGRTPNHMLDGHDDFGVASFGVAKARELNQKIQRDPMPSEPAHVLVVGIKTKSISRKMAKIATTIIEPKSNANSDSNH